VRGPAALLAVLWTALAQAQWQWGPPVDLAGPKAGVFHHVEASGRRNVAVSAGTVAVTWEDNRSGAPHCYLALRAPGAGSFREYGFGQGECYEPGIAALPDGRFGLIWEDAQGVGAALADAAAIGPQIVIAPQGGQGSLAWSGKYGLQAAWSSPDGRWRRVWRARLEIRPDGDLALSASQPADPQPPVDDQLYPVVAASADTLALAWEDRRNGHTVIYGSTSADGSGWTPPARISTNHTGRVQGILGRGMGAMRATLVPYGGDRLAAVWLDKRDFLSGYDVYAALSDDGGLKWGTNVKAQDSFGNDIAQWHATAAGNGRGELAIAWDDNRDGSPDVWLTWLKPGGGFADNTAPPPAAGPGDQTDPAIALDDAGNLYLVWVERGEDGTTRLRFAVGEPAP
jgi:hypothetical protein